MRNEREWEYLFPPPHTHTHTHPHCVRAAIDGVSELRGDVLINLDTLGIDLTSCCNDLLVFVKDHCLSGLQLMCRACLIVMETIITVELGRGSAFGSLSVAHTHTVSYIYLFRAMQRNTTTLNTSVEDVRGQREDAIIGVNTFHNNVKEVITNWMD